MWVSCTIWLFFVVPLYVAQVLSVLFWNGSCFHIPHALNLYHEVFIFLNLLNFIIIIIIVINSIILAVASYFRIKHFEDCKIP